MLKTCEKNTDKITLLTPLRQVGTNFFLRSYSASHKTLLTDIISFFLLLTGFEILIAIFVLNILHY